MSESEKSARMNIVWIHCSPAEPPPAASSGCMAIRNVHLHNAFYLDRFLGQFTRNYTQTTKRGLLTTNKG